MFLIDYNNKKRIKEIDEQMVYSKFTYNNSINFMEK